MLVKHRGEVEFDFRSILHASLLDIARESEEEAWRLLRILLTRTDSQVFALAARWERPLSTTDMLLASLYTTWSGNPHPLMPDAQERVLTDVESRLADMALENMNRR